jgi:hypothetical protein
VIQLDLGVSTDAQCTPRDLAHDLGEFDLDVCSNARSHIRARASYVLERGQDGLALPWTGLVQWAILRSVAVVPPTAPARRGLGRTVEARHHDEVVGRADGIGCLLGALSQASRIRARR